MTLDVFHVRCEFIFSKFMNRTLPHFVYHSMKVEGKVYNQYFFQVALIPGTLIWCPNWVLAFEKWKLVNSLICICSLFQILHFYSKRRQYFEFNRTFDSFLLWTICEWRRVCFVLTNWAVYMSLNNYNLNGEARRIFEVGTCDISPTIFVSYRIEEWTTL